MKRIGWSIVGDGEYGFKFFGETYCDPSEIKDWQELGYKAVPIMVDMTPELEEFYFY
jgi:hypothetical protein